MTEQYRTTDIENLWQEWNKANQDLWTRMMRSWTTPNRPGDVFSLWQEWNKANQDLWNRMLQNWIETEAFAQMLGKAMENYLTMHDAFGKAVQGYMGQALRTMKIASADDITRLAEMIINLENKVDRLVDEIEETGRTTDETSPTKAAHKGRNRKKESPE
jgi:nitrogen regulatory protein PII